MQGAMFSTTGFGASTTTAAPQNSAPTPGFGGSSFGSFNSGASFGSTQPSKSAFGTSTPSTGFGFGSTSSTGAQPTSAGFGSFGSTPSMSTASTLSTSGFGAPAVGFSSTTQPTSSFGFGGGFGSTSTPATSFGAAGFGGTTASTAKPFGGGAGGFSTQAAPGAAPTMGFGSPGGFGSTTAGFGSGFGGSGTSGFGTGTSSSFLTGGGAFGGSGGFSAAGTIGGSFSSLLPNVTGASQPGMQPAVQQVNVVAQEFEKLQSYYAGSREVQTLQQPNSYGFSAQPAPESLGQYQLSMAGKPNEDCKLKAVVYRKKGDPAAAGESLLKGRQLEQAEQDNTDPENLVPVLEFGIDSLKKRFDHQVSEAAKTEEYLKTLNDIISAVETSSTQVSIQFDALRMKEVNLYRSLLTVMRKIEVLKNRQKPLQSTELRYKERMEALLVRMQEPVRQLMALNSSIVLQEQQQRDCFGDLENSDEIDFLCDALQQQREGLEYVSEMLRKDIRDINIMKTIVETEKNEAVAKRGQHYLIANRL